MNGVSAIDAGHYQTCALKDGGVWCWGANFYGQLGNNGAPNSPVLVAVWGLGSGVSAVNAASSITPGELRCEYRTDPIGLGETKPRLAWKLTAVDPAARGLRQSAWQVLVASTPADLAQNRGDFWDSGRVASAATNNIVYAGRPLVSRVACWWKVRVWDQAGAASAWSATHREARIRMSDIFLHGHESIPQA